MKVYDDGEPIALPVPAGAKAGEPVKVGALVGVLVTDRAEVEVPLLTAGGELNPAYNAGGGNPQGQASVDLGGVFELPVSEEVAEYGQPIYITASRDLSTSATSNSLFGHAVRLKDVDAGGVVGTVHVKLLKV